MCKMRKKHMLLFLSLTLITLTGCTNSATVSAETSNSTASNQGTAPIAVEIFDPNSSPEPYAAESLEDAPTSEVFPSEPAFEEYDITLMALGDNLIHMGVVHTGKQADGSLNYDFLFGHFFYDIFRNDS